MAQAQPDQFLNVVALAIIIMPFLTTEALERIDDWVNDRRHDYMRVATMFALFLAFFITVLVAALVLNIAGQVYGGLRITTAYFLFVALYLPTLGLLVPAVSEWVELIYDSELNGRVVLAELVLVGIVAGLLISANPVG